MPASKWTVHAQPALDPARGGDGSLWPERWPARELTKRRAEVGEHDWESLYQQHPVARRGRVFAAFTRASGHVLPHAEVVRRFRPDGRWLFRRTLGAIDWGFTDPGCLLMFGETGAGVIYVVAEEYHRQKLVDESGWLPIYKSRAREFGAGRLVADPSEPGYITATRRHLNARPIVENAYNDIADGIRLIQIALQKRPDGQFGMYVSDACANLIAEAEAYSYRTVAGALTEQPHDRDNHAMDCWRYGTAALVRSTHDA